MGDPPAGISVHPVPGLPEFGPGDDLAAAVAEAAPWLADDDVVVVTSKVVARSRAGSSACAPGRTATRCAGGPSSRRPSAWSPATGRWPSSRPPRAGVAAAGIGASNVARDSLVLLPADGDASAAGLRAGLREHLGVDVAVVVSDTFGRTWREGLADVAVGAAGIAALDDHRGSVDVFGNRLETTRVAVVDELASVADLVKGRLAGLPVAVVRGLRFARPEPDPGTRPLVRAPADDLFPYGSRDLVSTRVPAVGRPRRAGELDAVAEGFRVASRALPEFPVVLRYGGQGDGALDVHLPDAVSLTTALNLGAVLGAAIVHLHADGWATRWEPVGTPGGSSLVGRLWLADAR